METELVEVHAIARGHVQGVFFRATTRDYANELGIKGTVKNLPDGTVEIYAQGARKRLERLLERIQGDSGPGWIDEMKHEFYQPKSLYSDFRVVY